MADYDMSQYVNYPSIKQYINLLAEFKVRLTNMNSNKIMLNIRKAKAFEVLFKEVSKLEGEELQKWKDKLEIVFKQQKIKAKKTEQDQVDFSGYNVGEDVIYHTYPITNYPRIPVKCMIKKINKCSITLAKYNCDIDNSELDEAKKTQGVGRIKFKWTNEVRLNDIVIVRNVSNITRRCDDEVLFQSYSKESHYTIDFGN
jgi:hypothetical protein